MADATAGVTRRSVSRASLSALALVAASALAPSAAPAEETPYDDTLAHLAEILGALHHLRPLCGATDETQTWRDQMTALLDAEQPTPARRQRFVDRFNLSYRSFAAVHRTCTPAARELAERYRREGEKLGRDALTRWGRP